MSKYSTLDDLAVPENVVANWQITVDLLAEIAGIPAALIMRVHAHEIEVFVSSHSPGNIFHPGEKMPLDSGLYCEMVMSTQRELLVPNALKDQAWDRNPDLERGMISYCGLSLTWPSGEIFGTLCVLDVQENAYTIRVRQLMARLRESIQLSLEQIYEASLSRSQIRGAENALRDSEARNQRYLDATQAVMVALDREGRISMINRAGQVLLGYTEAELLGRNWFASCLPQPDGLDSVYPVFRRMMDGELEAFAEYESVVLCRDGSQRLVGWRNSYFRDEEGRIIGALKSGADITERKRVEDELAKHQHQLEELVGVRTRELEQVNAELSRSEHRFRTVFETTPEAISVTRVSDGLYLEVNDGWLKLSNRTRDEVIGKTSLELNIWRNPLDRQRLMQGLERDGHVNNLDFDFLTKEGRVVHGLVSARWINFEGHACMLVMTRDITERLQAEAEYKSILETSQDGFWLVSAQDGCLVDVNQAASRMLGYSRAELLQMTVADIDVRESPEEIAHKVRAIMEQPDGKTRFQTRHRRRDGGVVDVEISAQYLAVRGGIFVVFVRDIGESLAANRALKEAKLASEAASRAKSAFLANMSHELRTPLTAILGFSDLLRRDPTASATQKDTLAIIHKSGNHLLELIDDVLDIAKIEAGRIDVQTAPFDVGGMVFDIIHMLRINAQSKGFQLLLDQASTFPRYIVGDEAKLRQILINLISNAIKATERGGVTLRLGVKHNHAEYLVMEVEDTGCGIAPQDQAKLMQPFVQVGSQGQQPGTGLGLAISRQFAELMGGSLTFSSTVGQGSTFRVDLPMQLASAEDIPPIAKALGDVIELEPGQQPFRVLVAEDQLESRMLLRRPLERVGFQVQIAENGAVAVARFKTWKPDFIWMDLHMPVMGGMEAVRRIRALPGGDKVKIAADTASTFKEQDAELLAAGFDAIVHKPFRAEQIFDCMERLLGLRFVREVTEEAGPAGRPELTAAVLTTLPPALRAELRAALLMLDSGHILELIDTIGKTAPELADALREPARRFDYGSMLRLLGGE